MIGDFMIKHLIIVGVISVIQMTGFIFLFALMDNLREIRSQFYRKDFKRLGFNILLVVLFITIGTGLNIFKGKLSNKAYNEFNINSTLKNYEEII